MKKKLILSLVLFHLLLVAGGAAHFPFWSLGRVGSFLTRYGQLTGAGAQYPFFAPMVGTTIRARFELFDSQGNRIAQDKMMEGPTRELDLRINNIIQMIDEGLFDVTLRHHLASSWAGQIMARYPEARKVTLRVESCDLPSMEDYQQGVRFDWEPFYSASFARKG